MSNAVTKHEVAASQAPVARSIDHMELISRAADSGNLELVERMMDLRDRFEKAEARKDFDEAIANAKAEIPAIIRNREGHNKKKYADFAAIASTIDPILGKYGLSYRFRTSQTDRISVTCILSHKAGHSEETTLSGPADTSGNKNAIQAIGSTLTYLQRYTLVQMLGLAAAEDDDGKAVKDAETISDEQELALRDLMQEVAADEKRFMAYAKIERLSDLPARDFDAAVRMLNAKRAK
ncbi:hypothetical protein GCM10007276_12010 [Agaricicola taiwanensis]|uniref:ERF family protein n=1 Tax=Agaricicola taiwanensis TaxID=591372 RepID=A0A8J2VRE0_9RHOB|nr:ERF family protein [Agaricicola taiwanensis]GGE36137.1 hypothetical protein GCM10007276_12010 [Agaricicola taiwanensis]